MFNSLERNIIYGNTYCALAHYGSDTNACIHVLICKRQKGELVIADKIEVHTIDDVKAQNAKLKYAHLVINNHQVLQKTIEIHQYLSDIVLINQTFPNIDLDAFYYEILRYSKKAFIYICRKKYVDELIKNYEAIGIFITEWSLGNSSIHSVVPFLENEKTIYVPNATISLENGEIIAIDALNTTATFQNEYYDIEGIQIEGKYINALGGAISMLGGVEDRISINYKEEQQEQQSYFKQHRLFSLGLPVAIGVLLIVFLVNFLCYNHYYGQVAVLQEIGTTNTLQKQRLSKKDSIVNQKQKLFEDVIASASSSASYIVDAIVADMPHTILLEKLEYQPLDKKIRKGKTVLVEKNTIIITGETSVNKDLSSWISSLENLEFTDRVSLTIEKKGKHIRFSITLIMRS